MEKLFTVIKDYKCEIDNPIKLHKGDLVQLGEKSDNNGPWPNWIYCISNRTHKEGWTPIQVLQIENGFRIATSDYDAKEMTVFEGDKLNGSIELNGWIWCRSEAYDEEGWVPKDCLK